MEKQAAYTYLADWFEYLNDDCDYENWSQYFVLRLKEKQVKKGLDVGCGSGYFTRAFFRAGFDTTGLDCSTAMLEKAEELSRKEGVRCRYLLGDIRAFKTHEKFDFVTAINDCFNYIQKNKLVAAFKNVAAALVQGGYFFFDISSERKFRKKIANTVSVDDREEVTYICFPNVSEHEATLEVSLFVKGTDGKYERKDERHTQYIYKEEEILSALNTAGFTIESVTGHLGEQKDESDRLSFVARKGRV